jgi:hypothetical protein
MNVTALNLIYLVALMDNPAPTLENGGGAHVVTFVTDRGFWLSAIVIFFGMFVVSLEYILLSKTDSKPTDVMRVLAVTLILVGGLFLITAGFDSDQISPVSGIFGTIAGYLLGKTPSIKKKRRKTTPKPSEVNGKAS